MIYCECSFNSHYRKFISLETAGVSLMLNTVSQNWQHQIKFRLLHSEGGSVFGYIASNLFCNRMSGQLVMCINVNQGRIFALKNLVVTPLFDNISRQARHRLKGFWHAMLYGKLMIKLFKRSYGKLSLEAVLRCFQRMLRWKERAS